MSDAVELVHRIKGDSIHPLDEVWVKALDRNGMGLAIPAKPIEDVAEAYASKYGSQGIVPMVWDETESKFKYKDLKKKWVWYE